MLCLYRWVVTVWIGIMIGGCAMRFDSDRPVAAYPSATDERVGVCPSIAGVYDDRGIMSCAEYIEDCQCPYESDYPELEGRWDCNISLTRNLTGSSPESWKLIRTEIEQPDDATLIVVQGGNRRVLRRSEGDFNCTNEGIKLSFGPSSLFPGIPATTLGMGALTWWFDAHTRTFRRHADDSLIMTVKASTFAYHVLMGVVSREYYFVRWSPYHGPGAAAEAGDVAAQWDAYQDLGDTREGFVWLCRAADQGMSEAQGRLGDIYYNGWFGFDKDLVRSHMWFSLASDGTDKWAEWATAQLEYRFKDLSLSDREQAKRMQANWEPGRCESELYYGPSAPGWPPLPSGPSGDLETIDEVLPATAVVTFRSNEYKRVPGVLDPELRAASEAGDAKAQWLAYRVIGYAPDGYQWLCRAADQGHTQARMELGYLYRSGISGFTQDYSHAYMWYRLAGLGAHSGAVESAMKKIEKDPTSCAKGQTCFIAHEIVQLQNVLHSDGVSEVERLLEQWQPGQCERELATARTHN